MTAAAVVIISGGAESVSLALAEVFWRENIAYAVISLTPSSLLRGLPGCVDFSEIQSERMGSPESAASVLLAELLRLRCNVEFPLAAFPTEDDGLRLLNLISEEITKVAVYSRMRCLQFGGLDKSELFAAMDAMGLSKFSARTVTLHAPEDIKKVALSLGDDMVIKPCFKPWRKSTGDGGLKVLVKRRGESLGAFEARVALAWPLADVWVAQERLFPLDGGERSACVVRSDVVRGCEVLEIRKYPVAGGSAIWVRSQFGRRLLDISKQIVTALDLNGMCELSFLADSTGAPRLLELNTRPWLQVDLVEKSGYPIVMQSLCALNSGPLDEHDGISSELDWFQPERLLLSLASGDCGSRCAFVKQLFKAFSRSSIFSVYSNQIPNVRRRWLMKNISKLIVGRD